MNIYFNNNISFGQYVSTNLLLRSASNLLNFEDAKLLNNELGVIYSGHIGFYKRAVNIVKKASSMDKNLAKIVADIKNTPREQIEEKIKNYVNQLGDKIDICV